MIPNGLQGTSSTSGGGNTSSSGALDATTSSSSGSSGGSSSSSYTDDSTNPNPTPEASGDDGGSDAPATTPGPTCTPGQACVDGIPSGWNGFVQLLVNNQGVDAGCAGPYGTAQPSIGGQTNPDGGPATCGTCACAAPDSGTGCSVAIGTGNLLCFGASPTTVTAAGACYAIQLLSNLSGDVKQPTATGSCTAGTASVTTAPPAPSWSVAVACGTAGDGGGAPASDAGAEAGTGTGMTCASGQACASVPGAVDSGMPTGVCIYQAGVQTCPPGGTTLFTNTFVVGAVEDSRGCDCTCGSMTCPTDGVVNVYNATGCTGATSSTLALGSGCKTNGVSNAKSAMYVQSTTGKAPTCGAGTTAPTGGVDIDGGTATTFCCIP
jgi:hypothetical protein